MNKTPIEWTHFSVNPLKLCLPDGTLINVCVHKSEGCRNCYAEGIVRRWWKKAWGVFPGYTAALLKLGTPVLVEEELNAVLRLSSRMAEGKADPSENKIFWNDMTDEFLDFWPDEFIDKLFAVRALTPNLIHQVLTKRAERMLEYFSDLDELRLRMGAAAGTLLDGDWIWNEGKRFRPSIEKLISSAHGVDFDENDNEIQVDELDLPLPNVHLGTSVEDQKTADERIPMAMGEMGTCRV